MNAADDAARPDAPPAPAPAPDHAALAVPPAFLLAVAPAPPAEETPPAPADGALADGALADGAQADRARYAKGAAYPPPVLALVEEARDDERPRNLLAVLEALLLVADDPPTISALAQATNVSRDAVEAALDAIERDPARGIRVQRHGNTVRLVTAPEAASFIERFLGLDRPNRLSRAALETLAIIAYQQPVTRSRVERVRGVSCDGALATLRQRELVEAIGELDTPGRPKIYATTPRFLDHFGLGGIDELPPLPEARREPTLQRILPLADTARTDTATTEAPAEAAERGAAIETPDVSTLVGAEAGSAAGGA